LDGGRCRHGSFLCEPGRLRHHDEPSWLYSGWLGKHTLVGLRFFGSRGSARPSHPKPIILHGSLKHTLIFRLFNSGLRCPVPRSLYLFHFWLRFCYRLGDFLSPISLLPPVFFAQDRTEEDQENEDYCSFNSIFGP